MMGMERIPGEDEYFSPSDPKHRWLDENVLHEPIGVLEPAEPVCVLETTTVAAAVRLMQQNRIGCVLVTRADGRLAGIFTERDVLRNVVGRSLDIESAPVTKLMTPEPEAVLVRAPIAIGLNKMSVGGFRHVPIVDDEGRPVGIVSVKDIVDYVVGFFPAEVLNVPPEPGLDVPKSREGA